MNREAIQERERCSGRGGVFADVALCRLALDGKVTEFILERLSEEDRKRISEMTQEQAIAELEQQMGSGAHE